MEERDKMLRLVDFPSSADPTMYGSRKKKLKGDSYFAPSVSQDG
jgi:hypothetical protein